MDRDEHTERASKLTRHQRDLDERHEGNRAGAEMSERQPTREPTRDQPVPGRPEDEPPD